MITAPNVLLVADEAPLADLYAAWLEDQYHVETAYSGQGALDKIDSNTDVVLLDRRMPGFSGDEVREEIRGRELECRVAMVTAVDPAFHEMNAQERLLLIASLTQDALHQQTTKER